MNQNEIESDLQQLAEDWLNDEAFSAAVLDRIEVSRKVPEFESVSGSQTAPVGKRWLRSGLAVSLAMAAALAVVMGALNGRRSESFVSGEMLSAAVKQAVESVESVQVTMSSFSDAGEKLDGGECLFDRDRGFVRGAWANGVWTIIGLDNGEFEWSCDHEKGVILRRPSSKQFSSYFDQAVDQTALPGSDYERLEEEDIRRNGQVFACYAVKNLAPFSDGQQRMWVFVDSNNHVMESRTWKFKNKIWNLVQESKYSYNVPVDASRFEPKFDKKLKIVDIEKEVNSLASLDDCLFSQNVSGLTYSIHRATLIEGGGLAVFASLREASPGSAKDLEMWNFSLGSHKSGDFYRIVNAEAMDRVRMQWFLLAPRRSHWKAYDASGKIVRVAADSSIVDGCRVKFVDGLWLPGRGADGKPKSMQVNVEFEFKELPTPVSYKQVAALVFKDHQRLPHVSYKELHTGVKLVKGVPTEQRASIKTMSNSDYQQSVVDFLNYWIDRDHGSEKNVIESQITKGFVTIRLPAVSVEGVAGFGDKQLERACQRKDLVQIDVSETSITDSGIPSLLQLGNLEKLFLRDTAITDESVDVLAQLKSLKKLDIRGTEVSPEGVARLKASLRNVEIEH